MNDNGFCAANIIKTLLGATRVLLLKIIFLSPPLESSFIKSRNKNKVA